MKQFKLIVSTPNGNAFSKEATMLSLYGSEGSLAVMANHIPFVTSTKAGDVKILTDEEEILATAGEGILTVTKESVTLLVGEFIMK